MSRLLQISVAAREPRSPRSRGGRRPLQGRRKNLKEIFLIKISGGGQRVNQKENFGKKSSSKISCAGQKVNQKGSFEVIKISVTDKGRTVISCGGRMLRLIRHCQIYIIRRN